jgi:curved DNA-binding protein CbpA
VAADLLSGPENVKRAYRDKAKSLHPDTNGEIARPEWNTLQAAKAMLDRHHGVK